jgi:hypothetical protein
MFRERKTHHDIARRALSAGALGLTATTLMAGRGNAESEAAISDDLLDRIGFWMAFGACT